MTGLPKMAHKVYQPEELAISWAVPVPVIVGWLRDGSLPRNEHGNVTRVELLRFVNSPDGQQLLREVRA